MPQTNPPIDTTAAEAYERLMVPGLFVRWTERLIDLAAPQPGEHVLDVACGAGIGARLAAIRTGSSARVVGLDIDPGAIDVARRVAQSGRLVASIWGSLDTNEGHRAVVQALEHQNVDTSGARRACSFANVDDLRDTAARAGFANVDVRTEDGVSHFESIQAFIDGMTIGASTRHAVALLPEAGRARFIEDVSAMLEPFLVGGELAYPIQTHVLFARP